MTVYVLSRIDDYDRSELLDVFASPDAAKRAAEESEPGRPFNWRQFNRGLYAPDGVFSGPVCSHSIDPFEVTS